MSATEVIEEIKQLPREERAKVLAFVADHQSELAGGAPAVRYVDDATFEKAKNLVLKENAELLQRLAQ